MTIHTNACGSRGMRRGRRDEDHQQTTMVQVGGTESARHWSKAESSVSRQARDSSVGDKSEVAGWASVWVVRKMKRIAVVPFVPVALVVL